MAQVLPPQAGGLLPPQSAIPGLFAAIEQYQAAAAVPSSGDTTQTNIAGTWQQAETSDTKFVQYLVGWGLFLLLLMLLNRTRAGHAIIYYTLLLILFFLLVYNYQAITGIFTAVTGTPATGPADSGQTNGPAQENYTIVQPGEAIPIQISGAAAPRFAVFGN